MNSYRVNDGYGQYLTTIQAASIDAAYEVAVSAYGPDVIIEREYTATGISIDPIWILLGLLLAAQLLRRKRQ